MMLQKETCAVLLPFSSIFDTVSTKTSIMASVVLKYGLNERVANSIHTTIFSVYSLRFDLYLR